jgi:hypothetical protein
MSRDTGVYVVPIDHRDERRVALYIPGLILSLADAEELILQLVLGIKRASDPTPLPEPEPPRLIVRRTPATESITDLLDL